MGKIVKLVHRGQEIEVLNLEKNETVAKAFFNKEAIRIKLLGRQNKPTLVLTGIHSAGEMYGVVEAAGVQKGYWKATCAVTLWKCGNHDPAHIAESLKRIKEITKKNQCKGWRKLR
jgi:hypothetical protein